MLAFDVHIRSLHQAMDENKRCYQMLNGLLIEGTAGSIVPDLKTKQSQILAQIKTCKWLLCPLYIRGRDPCEMFLLSFEISTCCFTSRWQRLDESVHGAALVYLILRFHPHFSQSAYSTPNLGGRLQLCAKSTTSSQQPNKNFIHKSPRRHRQH